MKKEYQTRNGCFPAIISKGKLLCMFFLIAALFAQAQPPPLGFSINNVSASGEAVVTVTANNFNNMRSIQGTIAFTPSIATFNRIETFGLPGLTNSSFGTTQVAAGKLIFSWAGTPAGVTVPNNTVIFSIRFNLVGFTGQQTAVSFSNNPTALEFTDNNFNTVIPTLTNGSITIAPCLSDADCNDGNVCTTDACSNGQCSHTPVICNDNNSCTADYCVTVTGNNSNSGCRFIPRCDDGDACTNDACSNGQCSYTPVICNDDNSCTADYCRNDTVSGCIFYSLCLLDDGDACTTDECINGDCIHTPIDCNDNVCCTIDECDGNRGCIYREGSYWSLEGNANTGGGVLGTTDQVQLRFMVNSEAAGVIGFANTAFGYLAGAYDNGNYSTAIGVEALSINSGNSNTAIGYHSLSSNITGSANTAIGGGALGNNNIGSYNTATGAGALAVNIAGNYNTAIGSSALSTNSSGSFNTANGMQALRFNNGSFNTANGYQSLYSNSTGSYNTANGWSALYSNTTGSYNTANGMNALYYNRGVNNTANGFKALYTNNTGSNNTANGWYSLSSNTTGSSNSGLGWNANVSTGNLSNATAIGANALVTASNNFVLGNSSVKGWGFGTPPFSGATARAIKVGTGATNGNGAYLTVGGAWTNTSARSKKEAFAELNSLEVLNKVKEMKVTRWKYIGTKDEYHIGPMAEDFYELFKVGDDSSIADLDKTGVLFLGMQAQQKMIEEQNLHIVQQQKQIDDLKDKMQQIDEMKGQFESALSQCCTGSQSSSQTTDNRQPITHLTDSPRLDQNIPNPFSQNTTIICYVPSTAKASVIKVYNLQGNELKSFTLGGNGVQNVVMNGGALPAGDYLYTLFIDGTKIDTKKMTLTRE